ncbi:MAG: hypothetical protein SA378_01115 [Sedimentibacter sp.]|uniref:hypothetical protein n=1 Tax=Sedimentibacter sp. TaxID=1960295 RepID=UPI002982B60D|nr:hypothetical protein [Sedimentibacter sp.]MDW5298731.1 hypothetical protein [Sedimentibacter sp.]
MKRSLTFNVFLGNEIVFEYHDISKSVKSSRTNHLQLLNFKGETIGFISIDILKNNLRVFNNFTSDETNTIYIDYKIQLKEI